MNKESKKVLITGANGFLGSNAARLLAGKGYAIRLMIRPSADIKAIADIPGELFYGDISNQAEVLQAVKGCDYVVHTASATGQWGVPYEEYKKINITATQNIAEACLLYRVKKLVYISTANTIGLGTKDKPGNELNAFNLFHINSGYINSKYIAQQYVLEQIASKKLPAVILNPTFMIGPYDVKPSSGQIILHGLNKKLLLYPPGGKNFVHVEDVCVGIANALELGKVGELYLIAGENLTYKEFFKKLQKVSGQHTRMLRVSPLVLKTIGLAGTLVGKLSGRNSAKLTYASACMLCIYNYYSGKKSVRDLDLQYTPIDQAISSALDWFKAHKYI